jgi:hypothetical protein
VAEFRLRPIGVRVCGADPRSGQLWAAGVKPSMLYKINLANGVATPITFLNRNVGKYS